MELHDHFQSEHHSTGELDLKFSTKIPRKNLNEKSYQWFSVMNTFSVGNVQRRLFCFTSEITVALSITVHTFDIDVAGEGIFSFYL